MRKNNAGKDSRNKSKKLRSPRRLLQKYPGQAPRDDRMGEGCAG